MIAAIGLYVYLVLGLIISRTCDRYFMRQDIAYGWAPAWPLRTLRIWTIIGLTILWPMIVFHAGKGIWHKIQVLRRAKRYGHGR